MAGAVGAAAALALAYLLLSLAWTPSNDLPVMLYEGFLVADLGRIPYRDFFEMNPPGTALAYAAIHQATGGAHWALRLVDLAVLAGIAAAACAALRRFGARSGLFASASFTALYLSTGPDNTLQREYLCVLLLGVSIALIFRGEGRQGVAGCLAAGLLAGLAATVKPPLAICWLPLLAHAAGRAPGGWRDWRSWPRPAALFAAGGALPLALAALWLSRHGALAAYLDIVRGYYPLYARIDGRGIARQGLELVVHNYLLAAPLLVGSPLVVAALLGGLAVRKSGDRRLAAEAATLAWVAVAALLYVAITGKFWLYHKVPLFYALSLGAALAASPRAPAAALGWRWARPAILAALLPSVTLVAFAGHLLEWRSGQAGAAEREQVLPMAEYLRTRTGPGDTFAPLDTATGAAHALYLARKPLYGAFVYDFHFYHHQRDPYILGLRRRFLAQFAGGEPDYLVECPGWRGGERGVPMDFPELRALEAAQYRVVLRAGDCRIRRRTEPPAPEPEPGSP